MTGDLIRWEGGKGHFIHLPCYGSGAQEKAAVRNHSKFGRAGTQLARTGVWIKAGEMVRSWQVEARNLNESWQEVIKEFFRKE